MASTLTVDNIQGATSSSAVKIPGHVVQCIQTYDNTNEATYSATAFTNILELLNLGVIDKFNDVATKEPLAVDS